MAARLDRLFTQPASGLGTASAALLAIAAAGVESRSRLAAELFSPFIALGVCLAIAVVLSYKFPIHIRHNTKIHVGSIPLFLITALLPPVLAAPGAGVAVLAGNLAVRRQRGTYLGDIASDAGRWALIVLLGSTAAHVQLGVSALASVPLVGGALVLWIGDIASSPLVLSPIVGEPPTRVWVAMVQEGALAEGVQYLVALLGALAARYQLWALLLVPLPTVLVYRAAKSAKELQETTRTILESMADAVDLRDPYTGGHSRRVAELVAGILRELPQRGPEADLIISSARVHDIGKIGIPDEILKKEGALSDEELALMQTHPDRGAELLRRYPDFARGVDIVRHHHERWDGLGYPHGLKGLAIPLGARVIAVADGFDAMISDRPYRRGMSVERATAILREGRGSQWDGRIVDAFLRSIEVQATVPTPPAAQFAPSATKLAG